MRRRLFLMFVLVLALAFAICACAPKTDATQTDDGTDVVDDSQDVADDTAADDAVDDAADDEAADDEADEGGEIIIGSIQDLSGFMAVAGNMTTWAVERAVADINAAGGINGKTLKVVTYDCKLDPNEGINAYNRLVDEGVQLL